MNTKDTRTLSPSVGSLTGLPPYRSQVHHAFRGDGCDPSGLPLDFAAHDATLPPRLADAADAKLYKQRLLSLCRHLEHHLQAPVSVSHDTYGRTVTVFGCVAYRVDNSDKTITPSRVDRNGYVQAGSYRMEVFRPLCTSWWLRWLIEDLGLSDRSDQRHLFLSDDEIADAETWLADTAYRLLRANPRFRRLRSKELPRALNLDPDLVSLALKARACRRGFHLVSDLYSTVWQYETEFRQVAGENPHLLPLLAVCARQRALDPKHDPIGQIRGRFLAAGLSKAAWRYVARYGARIFKLPWALAVGQSLVDVAIEYLRVLDEAGLPPPPPPVLLNVWLRRYVERGTDRVYLQRRWCGVPRDVLAIALRQADAERRSPGLTEFVNAFLGVAQWAGITTPVLDKNQQRAGWPWLVRHWKAWEWEERIKAETEGLEWVSMVWPFTHGVYQVIPLCSARALVEEGMAMRTLPTNVSQAICDCFPCAAEVPDVASPALRSSATMTQATGRFSTLRASPTSRSEPSWPTWVTTLPNTAADARYQAH